MSAVSTSDPDAGPSDEPTPSGRTRAVRPWLAAGLTVGVVGAVVAVGVVVAGSDEESSADTDPVRLQAVAAETRDLVQTLDLDGTMTYAAVETATANTDGVVTSVVESGASVVRGDVIAEIDAVPVTVAYGSTALYRTMEEGLTGEDVLLLERHLSALGYHVADVDDDGNPVDDGFVVDGEFDRATTRAVERWQEDLGVEPIGAVDPAGLVVLAGPSLVTSVSVATGDAVSIGEPLAEVSATSVVVDGVTTNEAGMVDVIAASGQVLASGDVLYAVDGMPRTAVLTDVEFDRDLEAGIDDGEDVRVVEEMLGALGYDSAGALVIDEVFDDATEDAVTAWEEDLRNSFPDYDADGAIELGDIVVLPPATTVGTVGEFAGSELASGTMLWVTESDAATRVIQTAIAVTDQSKLAIGDEVDVEFPGGDVVVGTVTSIATSSTTDPASPDAEATLAVEIGLASVPETARELAQVDVTVMIVDEMAAGVVTVPASALVARGDGGFAVERVIDGGTQFVAVEPGMYSEGFVEVTGIDAGDQVVVPS